LLVKRKDLEPDEADDAVPFVSQRFGFNCVKLTSIVSKVLRSTAVEKIVMNKFKSATINDNHLYRLRLPECSSEISEFFDVEGVDDAGDAASSMRLEILDRIQANSVTAPTAASDADYDAAANWVARQPKKQGSLKKAVTEWLTTRNVELQWHRLQQRCAKPKPEDSQPKSRGPRRHMSDLVFLKWVLPVMQQTGPLKHSVETWMDAMCAVDMLTNVRVVLSNKLCTKCDLSHCGAGHDKC